jgi:uncharacterized protein
MLSNIIRRFLIFPGSQSQGKYNKLPLPYQDLLISLTTNEGYQISLLCGESLLTDNEKSTSRESYSLLYFYGNGMCLLNSTFEFNYFRKLGLNVIISEYIGFGLSSGTATEKGCYQTARAAYQYLTETREVPSNQILVGGWSLGASVATYLAKMYDVAGLILLSPFTNLSEEASQIFPFLPQSFFPKQLVDIIIPDHFDNSRRITQVKCPVFIAHGTLDDVVPFEMAVTLSRKAEESGKKVTFCTLEGASHNDIFEGNGIRLSKEINQFVSDLSNHL